MVVTMLAFDTLARDCIVELEESVERMSKTQKAAQQANTEQ